MPPNNPLTSPTSGLSQISWRRASRRVGRRLMKTGKAITAKPMTRSSTRSGSTTRRRTANRMVTKSGTSNGQNRRTMGRKRPPWKLCIRFEATIGTVVSATAVLRLTSMVSSGTATSGRPMPTTPLTVLPANRPSEQRNRTKGVTPAQGPRMLALQTQDVVPERGQELGQFAAQAGIGQLEIGVEFLGGVADIDLWRVHDEAVERNAHVAQVVLRAHPAHRRDRGADHRRWLAD